MIISLVLLIIYSVPVFAQDINFPETESAEDEGGSSDDNLEKLIDGSARQEAAGILVSAYGIDNAKKSVYAFISPDSLPEGKIQVKLVQSGSADDSAEMETDYQDPESYSDYLQRRRLTVRYVFLIDRSTSMPAYTGDVKAYIRSIVESDKENDISAVYDIAGCGKKMEMVKSDLTDVEAVDQAVDSMSYDEEETDLYSGIVNAMTYINSKSLQPGSLTNLILITDGVPFVEEGKDENDLKEKAAKRIRENPETVVHTLCLGNWEEGANDYLCTGTGKQEELGLSGGSDHEQAVNAGKKVSDFINSLYLCVFETDAQPAAGQIDLHVDYRNERTVGDTKYTVEDTGTSNTLENIKFLMVSDVGLTVSDDKGDSAENTGSSESSTSEDDAAQDGGTTAVSGESGDASTKDSSASSSGTDAGAEVDASMSGDTAGTSTNAEGAKEETDPDADQSGDDVKTDGNSTQTDLNLTVGTGEDDQDGFSFVYILAGIAAAAAAAVIAALILKKKAGRKDSESEPVKPAPVVENGHEGIVMRIEILKGEAGLEKDIYYLKKELFIGSDPEKCDIVLSGSGISPYHARIFQRDGVICIEDLRTDQGTYHAGKRLISSSRLRSGDKIMTGGTEFVIWF